MKRTSKIGALVLGAALLGLSLSGCASTNTPNGADQKQMAPDTNHDSDHAMSITDKQGFAEAMIPHHQQAIVISELAQINTSNTEVLAIASKISSAQGSEIEKMTPWLEGKEVDSNMIMDGMLSTFQLAALRTVKNADFDKLFIEYMIQHHEGAVKMAAEALGLDDPELTDFANEIIVTQSAEIEELMALQNN